MKLKLTILGLCFLTTNVQSAFTQAQPAGAAATTGSAMAGVVKAAQPTPPVVRVDGGQLQGTVDDGVVSFKGIPFAAPPGGRPAVAAASTGGAMDRRAPSDGIRGGLHAGTARPSRAGCASGASVVGRLSVPECLASRERRARGEVARHGLDLWGRIRVRLERHTLNLGDSVR
jgi:hypothetical protein